MKTKEFFEINIKSNIIQKPELGYNPPLLIMFGRDSSGSPIVSFSQFPVDKAFSDSDAIEVKCKKLNVGYRYDLKLKDIVFEEIFYMLFDDLLNFVACEEDRIKYAKKLVWRYKCWCKLLKRRKNGLNNEQKQGLFGELYYILKKLKDGVDPDSLIDSWKGPMMAAQDFIEKGAWAEIKTIKQNADSVQISSLEQLDNPAGLSAEESKNIKGRLIIVRINTSSASPCPTTLCSLVDQIKERLPSDSDGVFVFEQNLQLLGYDHERELMDSFVADVVDYQEYDANAVDFPKYRAMDVNSAIVGMRYELSISAISEWKVDEK